MPTIQTEEQPNAFQPFEPARARRAGAVLPTGFVGLADGLGAGALLRLRAMMAGEGETVHLARLCYDRLYAYERIAAAHASGNDALRRLALELFQIYHRRPVESPAQ